MSFQSGMALSTRVPRCASQERSSLPFFAPSAILDRLGHAEAEDLLAMSEEYPGVEASDVLHQLSLHLPRFDLDTARQSDTVLREAGRLAERLFLLRRQYLDCIPQTADAAVSVAELCFSTVSDEVARPILARFHYLLSFRGDATYFGLTARTGGRWPVAIVSLSPFDLSNILPYESVAGSGLEGKALVLSRVFGFPAAPRNSLSFLLARVRRWLAFNRPEVEMLVTYCNPNVGFTGASYAADNWFMIGLEQDTRYAFLDQNYVTDRRIFEMFGACSEKVAAAEDGPRLRFSACELEPLYLFGRTIRKSRWREQWECRTFPRWSCSGQR